MTSNTQNETSQALNQDDAIASETRIAKIHRASNIVCQRISAVSFWGDLRQAIPQTGIWKAAKNRD